MRISSVARLLAAAPALVVASALAPLPAQVCVTGIVQPVNGPTICMQGETHYLQCSRVFLVSRSGAVDLNRYVGQNVRITGREIGATCTLLDVARVDPPLASLTWCGSGSTGCPLKLKICPIGMGRWWLFLGLAPDFRPIGCATSGWIDGTLLLRDPIYPIGNGGSGICGEVTLQIPLDNSLVGVTVYFQGARQDIGPVGPLELSDVQCVRLAPFMPPCAPVGC
ncbi:MAG: hypothetical protein IPM29_30410 [Planctomycetes bacterium]|nr:hypothetical protein [Planctomycetota bacterium]